MTCRSLAEYLDNFLRYGQEIAYVQPQGYRTVRWPYLRVAQMAFQFACELDARGIVKGERILLWGPNCAEWVAAFLGCAMRGVVVVPIDDISLPVFARRVYEQVNARLLVCAREHVPESMPALVLEDLVGLVARHPPHPYPPIEIDPADALEIVFTSGTTAEPRGVVISHGNVLANVEPLEQEIRRYLKYERPVHPVRFLNLLPLSHVFGQFLGIFLPQLMGGTVIFQGTMKPAEIMRNIRKERVSVLVTVPRVLQSLRGKIERDLADAGKTETFRTRFRLAEGKHFLRRWWIFRGIRKQFGWKFWAFISGGASLDRETEEFWDRLGYAAIQGYGLTETTSLISLNHPFRLGKGSIGKVLAGREVKLAADGEISIRGGGVAAKYWDGKSQRPLADADGWFQTGDIGEFDAAGNLYFKGRKKEVIVTPAGMNIYPEDLEAALRSQPAVKDVVVVPWARGGNAEPCAAIILRDRQGNAEDVVTSANLSLAEYQRINLWMTWPDQDFPRTSTQKPRRDLILQTVAAQLERKGAPAVESTLAGMIRDITGRSPGALSTVANLECDLNLSSLDRVELLSTLEDRYQVDLSETSFAEASTLDDLQQMLQGNSSPRARFHYPRFALNWPIRWARLAVHYLLLRPAVFLLGWPRVIGEQNLQGQGGPFLVICNHIGDVDPGFVLTALPSRLRHKLAIATGGEALQVLRTPPPSRGLMGRSYDRVKWFLGVSLLNLFPLPKEAGFRDSFAYAGECVDRGYSVLVFPEGRHTPDGNMLPFRSGIGLLANDLKVPVLPMRIDGLFARKRAGKRFAWPGQIQVRIGAPVQFKGHRDPQSIARDLRKIVEELL